MPYLASTSSSKIDNSSLSLNSPLALTTSTSASTSNFFNPYGNSSGSVLDATQAAANSYHSSQLSVSDPAYYQNQSSGGGIMLPNNQYGYLHQPGQYAANGSGAKYYPQNMMQSNGQYYFYPTPESSPDVQTPMQMFNNGHEAALSHHILSSAATTNGHNSSSLSLPAQSAYGSSSSQHHTTGASLRYPQQTSSSSSSSGSNSSSSSTSPLSNNSYNNNSTAAAPRNNSYATTNGYGTTNFTASSYLNKLNPISELYDNNGDGQLMAAEDMSQQQSNSKLTNDLYMAAAAAAAQNGFMYGGGAVSVDSSISANANATPNSYGLYSKF
jgi:hypothetical protein